MKIIAEIGSNCRTLEEAIASIDGAKRCQANMVKFQLIEPGDLSPESKKQVLDKEWIRPLSDHCVKEEIEFMCSAFSSANYRFINKFVQRHKIASCEATDIDILETVNSFKKPVLVSSGCVTPKEMRDYVLPKLKDCAVTIMYCVSEYPCRLIDLRHIDNLVEICGTNYSYGFSDHTAMLSLKLYENISIIEKHVNFIPGMISDDSVHSLDEVNFKLMIRSLRGEYISMQDTYFTSTRDNHMRRPIALHNINAGEKIVLNFNASYYRQADLRPALDIRTNDFTAKAFIPKGSLISLDNVG